MNSEGKRYFSVLRWLLLPVAMMLNACTTTGSGLGSFADAQEESPPVSFSWTSTDNGISGMMTASLPGESYQGKFFQITKQTRVEVLYPLWSYWRHGWYDWSYWGPPMMPPYTATKFITRYSGKVVANLQADNKKYMRCRFHLLEPAQGMTGGGEGECQLSDGRTVKANFAEK
jgi:hypothetical protein